MKKAVCIIIALVFFASSACASGIIDLSGMTYQELINLKERINLAIWECQEWQEVTVPQGLWEVGKDIPAGHWTVRAEDGWFTKVAFGDTLDSTKTGIKITTYFASELIYSPSYEDFDKAKDISEFSFNVKKGDYIKIDFGSAVFTPYTGKPDLGFK